MHVYVKRGYQGRIKQEADEIGEQYAPNHTASLIITNTTATSATLVGSWGGVPVPHGVTVTFTDSSTNLTKSESVDTFGAED
jgi:hypothetical protein